MFVLMQITPRFKFVIVKVKDKVKVKDNMPDLETKQILSGKSNKESIKHTLVHIVNPLFLLLLHTSVGCIQWGQVSNA